MAIDKSYPHLKIAIVGGGPGGLATAIALDKVPNVQVTLYEQAKVLREVGAGISIGRNTWNVLELLGVADSLTSGHPTLTVLNLNGTTGEELSRFEKKADTSRLPSRTQRTKLQSALRSHVPEGTIKLGMKLVSLDDLGPRGVLLKFADGSSTIADLVVGADGIRSIVRDAAWKDYKLEFTGTTIWRTLLPWDAVNDLDERFSTTAWWHSPTTHVYFSPVGQGLWEIAARAYQDPAVHAADKYSWGVPVANDVVESHFKEYLPQIREALGRVPQGGWREFAAFAGPELDDLTNWNNKIVLVGDSSHALSGAFGSGAGFAMEDGWVLAQALEANRNNVNEALPRFNEIRLPYYSKMYSHLAEVAQERAVKLSTVESPTPEDRVRNKIIQPGGKNMQWIYGNHIGRVWDESIVAPLDIPSPDGDDFYFQPTPQSPIPRYLYRVSTPRSYCYTDAEWVKSRDSWMCRPGGHQNIFQAADPTETAQNIHRHLNWRFSPEDNLVSWTSSLLFAIQFAFYRHASPTDSSSFGTIKICVIDTTLFGAGVFMRDVDLISYYKGQCPELASFGRMRRETQHYFGEYLTQGALKIKGKCSIVSMQAMIDAGLLDLGEEFQASHDTPQTEGANKVVQLREELLDTSTTNWHRLPSEVPKAAAIGALFHPPFRLAVTIQLIALCPGNLDRESLAASFAKEALTSK